MESQTTEPRGVLQRIWLAQQELNRRIKLHKPASKEYWSQKYLLGLTGEIGEVLQETVWKDHRKGKDRIIRDNLGRELADLFHYVLCLFQLYDFSLDEMLQIVENKGRETEKRLLHEFHEEPLPDSLLVFTDIDGTLGDWRGAFRRWFYSRFPEIPLREDPMDSLDLYRSMGIPYTVYREAKEEFEEKGGYLEIEPYLDTCMAIPALVHREHAVVYAYTSRPDNIYSRIWMDTVQWLDKAGLGSFIRETRIGGDQRVLSAHSMKERGYKVVALEDDPAWTERYLSLGIPVVLRSFPYNQSIAPHPLLRRSTYFTAQGIREAADATIS